VVDIGFRRGLRGLNAVVGLAADGLRNYLGRSVGRGVVVVLLGMSILFDGMGFFCFLGVGVRARRRLGCEGMPCRGWGGVGRGGGR